MTNSLFDPRKPPRMVRWLSDPIGEVELAEDGPGNLIQATLIHIDKVLSVGDRVMPGALDDWLAALNKGAGHLQMLWGHLHWEPIGYWQNLRIESKKLLADGVLYDYIPRAVQALEGIRRKDEGFGGVSLGIASLDFKLLERGKKRWGFDHYKVAVREASMVVWPADRQARARVMPRRKRKYAAPYFGAAILGAMRHALETEALHR